MMSLILSMLSVCLRLHPTNSQKYLILKQNMINPFISLWRVKAHMPHLADRLELRLEFITIFL